MRVAVFSDVHGNLTALESVLAGIASEHVDSEVFAGDLCLLGPRPAECLARLQAWEGIALYGNTDEFVLGRQQPPEQVQELAAWTAAQLSVEQLAWLESLPFGRRFQVSAEPDDGLLVVHANPVDVNQLIYPSERMQEARYGRVVQADEELTPMLKGVQAAVLAFGHIHVPSIRQWRDMQLVNISSVSMPGDEDGRAKYGLFTWHEGLWSFERRFVAYPVEEERGALVRNKPPRWEFLVEQIDEFGFVPQRI